MKKLIILGALAASAGPANAQSLNDVLRTVTRVVAKGATTSPANPAATAGSTGAATLPNGKVSAFDIAGVKIGFTPEQSQAQAGQVGFRLKNTSKYTSFAARRLQALRARRPDFPGSGSAEVARTQYFDGPSGDRLMIEYAAMPEGPRAEKIVYFFNPSRMDRNDFERTIQKKFGSPNGKAVMVGDSLWCDHRCESGEAIARYSPGVHNMLTLDGSGPMQSYISNLISAEVERLAPKERSSI